MSNSLKFKFQYDTEKKIRRFLKMDLELSSRLIRSAARDGRIKVNGKVVTLRYMLKKDDIVEVIIQKNETQNIEPENLGIEVIYEDEDIIAVNKRPNMVVHPTKNYSKGTLANGVLYHFKQKGENCIVRLVSRLDRDTSGIILIAKNQFSHMSLAREMQNNNLKKEYMALVHGKMKKSKGIINQPIYTQGEGFVKRIVDPRGKESITRYEVVEEFFNASLVHFILETGRTHQIRVHMDYLGNTLIGDSLYGENFDDSEYIDRQALHAYKLTFLHPRTKELIELKCDLPEDINNVIDKLRNRCK